MINIKERPRCRKQILKLLDNLGCQLEDLWVHLYWYLTDGMLKQTKKMILEAGNPKKLTLTHEDWDFSERSYKMCRFWLKWL